MLNQSQFIKTFNSVHMLNPKTPSFQRPVIKSHVDILVNHAIQRKLVGKLPVFGIIDVAIYNKNGTEEYFIIDGQHRMEAFKILANIHNYIIDVNIMVYSCYDENEAYQIFQFKNMGNVMGTHYINGTVSSLDREIETYLSTLPLFKATSTRRPYTCISNFIEAYKQSPCNKTITTLDQFKLFIFNFNNILQQSLCNPQNRHSFDLKDSMYSEMQKHGNYLGADLRFSWMC
jgi:hypothetical protein